MVEKMKDVWIVALIAIIGFIGVGALIYLKPTEVTVTGQDYTPSQAGTGVQATCDLTQKSTLVASTLNGITGSAATTEAHVYSSNHGKLAGPVNVSTATSVTTNMPMYFDGYVIIGNDDAQSTTDVGTEYYFRKIPVTIGCDGSYVLPDTKVYEEGAVTFTFYDDGTSESTANVTIGSGETYKKAALKFEASANDYVGNPDFDRPFGLCFNESTAGMFEAIRPKNYDGTFRLPQYLAGYNYKPDCYILPFGALKDGEISPEVPLYIEARSGQDPGVTANVSATLVEYCWSKDDALRWRVGWADDSVDGTDTFCGIDDFTNTQTINMA